MRLKGTDEIFAMKILNKWEMLKRAEVKKSHLVIIAYIFLLLAMQ